MTRPALRIEAAHINGEITFSPSSTGSSLVNSSADGFSIVGADDILIEGSTFDGQCRVAQNWIQPAGGDGVRRFVIRGNTLRNYHICSDESVHSEAIFVAALSQGGLIEGNTFTDNGTTGHLFFSWFGGDPGSDYPRDICVRGNSFTRSLNAYYHIQFRQEIPSSANIDIDPSNVVGPSIGSHATSLTSAFERPCD